MSRLIDADFLGLTDMEIIMCDGDYKEALKMLIDKIEHAPTIELEPKWVRCTKRLPDEDEDYLVLYHTRSKYSPYIYDVMSFANDLYQIDKQDFCDKKGQKGWFYYDREYGYCEDNSVYAWMLLPLPYQEEGDA